MKICPQCQTQYTDDSLQYCLQDGTPLGSFPNQVVPLPSQNWTESETIVRPQQTAPIYPQTAATVELPAKKSNTALVVFLTMLGTLIVFGALLGAWIVMKNRRADVAVNVNNNPPKNAANANVVNVSANNNANQNRTPSPSPTVKANTNAASPTPAPDIDEGKIKSEVKDKIDEWQSLLEAGDLDGLMNDYGDRLDYYFTAGQTSAAAVRANKQKAFEQYDSISFDINNVRVTPDASGARATAVFDKKWEFSGEESRSEGKVQSQLQFTKVGGAWKITGERDLKVYYTR